jgi:hypothetical protein
MISVSLAVDTNPDGSPFYGSILVYVLGENSYRVAASLGLAEGIVAGDDIELALDERLGFAFSNAAEASASSFAVSAITLAARTFLLAQGMSAHVSPE